MQDKALRLVCVFGDEVLIGWGDQYFLTRMAVFMRVCL